MQQCEHKDFEAQVAVSRIEDTKQFVADVTIRCAYCKVPFTFLGLPCGVSVCRPLTSFDGTEARLPIAPFGRRAFEAKSATDANTLSSYVLLSGPEERVDAPSSQHRGDLAEGEP